MLGVVSLFATTFSKDLKLKLGLAVVESPLTCIKGHTKISQESLHARRRRGLTDQIHSAPGGRCLRTGL
jgi:hypothetical protein